MRDLGNKAYFRLKQDEISDLGDEDWIQFTCEGRYQVRAPVSLFRSRFRNSVSWNDINRRDHSYTRGSFPQWLVHSEYCQILTTGEPEAGSDDVSRRVRNDAQAVAARIQELPSWAAVREAQPEVINAIDAQLFALGREWAKICPRPDQDVLAAWEELLTSWCADARLPYLARKSKLKGQKFSVQEREVIATDNSPANWALFGALSGKCPSPEEVRSLIQEDRLPICKAMSRELAQAASYRGALSRREDLNVRGWKVAHIRGVGEESLDLSKSSLEEVERHFKRFISPSNLFVIPMEWGGIAEVPAFLTGFVGVQK